MTTPTFALLYEEDENHKPWVKLLSIGNQWFWTYELRSLSGISKSYKTIVDSYLRKGYSLNLGSARVFETSLKLILPSNKWIKIYLTGINVIHSFGLSTLGLKFDGIPGRLNSLYFQFRRLGF